MSTIETSETSTTAAEATAIDLPVVTKAGRVPIKSWAGELDPRTLEQATNVSNLPFADYDANVASLEVRASL